MNGADNIPWDSHQPQESKTPIQSPQKYPYVNHPKDLSFIRRFKEQGCQVQFKVNKLIPGSSKYIMSIQATSKTKSNSKAFNWDESPFKIGLTMDEVIMLKHILDNHFMPLDKFGNIMYGEVDSIRQQITYKYYHDGQSGGKSFNLSYIYNNYDDSGAIIPPSSAIKADTVSLSFNQAGNKGFIAGIKASSAEIYSLKCMVNWALMSAPVILGWSEKPFSMQDLNEMLKI